MNIPKNLGRSFRNLSVALSALMMASSCTAYYYVRTDVSRNLEVDRYVYREVPEGTGTPFSFASDSRWKVVKVDEPFAVDFYDVTESMTHYAYAGSANIGDLAVAWDLSGDGIVKPKESLGKRFRWFYTYYDYKAVFKGLELPLPFDGYMSKAQTELFFRGADSPKGWNGVEMLFLLDTVNQSFAQWYSDAVYLVMCNIFRPFCSSEQKTVLDTVKQSFMEGVELESMFAMKPDEFEDRLAAVAPGSGFGKLYESNAKDIDEAYDREAQVMDFFETAFVYSVDMPGRYFMGNAVDFIDGNPMWKVDAYRLMNGEVELAATTRKANVLIFILTFAAIAALLLLFSRRLPGRRR